MAELHNYLVVGAVLFVLGAIGFLTRRNMIMMTLSAEMMLQGVSLNLVAFSYLHGNNQGQAFAVFIVTVAACEAGVALALFIAVYKRRKTLDADAWRELG
jgi:NADH-quinone oxidoreductase subunit K